MLVKTSCRVRYLALFVLLIHVSNSVRIRSYLHNCTLLMPAESPWMKLYHYGDASSFLTMTGMSWQAFLQIFDVLFVDHHQQPNKGGRPLLMEPTAQLGLFKFFVGSTIGISLVVQKLKRHPLARVKFPDVDKMASFARQIQIYEPKVDDVIGFMYGLSLT
jgi:hypothetical protein